MEKLKIGIGLPAYRGVIASGQMKMWVQFGACMNRPEIRDLAEIIMLADIDMNGIDNARNTLLKIARQGGVDWLLMIDADTWCDPGSALVEMIIHADREGAAAVAAPVKIRGYGQTESIYRFEKIGENMVRVIPYPKEEWIDRPFEIDAAGAAILAVHTRRSGENLFAFVERDGIKVSEDIEFCRRLRDSGEKILCDPRFRTLHVNKPDVLLFDPFGG